jgi:16S rRNA (guanine527-N7)-methyltransferase
MRFRHHIAGPADFSDAFDVSRESVAKLETYAEALRKWQKTINLVAPSTIDDIWHRHFADSAQLLRLSRPMPPPPAGQDGPLVPLRWLDVGSGAGFPGLVLAILLAETPGARMTLIESDQRKSAFLREVARQTAAPVDILSIRIEKAATQFNLPLPEVVTARALAPLTKLLQLVYPFFGPDTTGLFLKGRDVEREVAEAQLMWRFEYELRESMTDEAARVVIVRDVEVNAEE